MSKHRVNEETINYAEAASERLERFAADCLSPIAAAQHRKAARSIRKLITAYRLSSQMLVLLTARLKERKGK
jgi:hypothetical protein